MAEARTRKLDVALASQEELLAEVSRLRLALEESRKNWIYHSDCRPNRRQAEEWRDLAKATNDKWADEVALHRDTVSVLAEAGVILEALHAAITWELSPYVMRKLADLLPRLRAAILRSAGK